MNYKILIFFITYLITLFVRADEPKEPQNIEDKEIQRSPILCDYKSNDLNEYYNAEDDVLVSCNVDGSCVIRGEGAVSSAGHVNITAAGTYIIQGSIQGQVYIDAPLEDFVHLVLEDATIFSSDGPAIYGNSAEKITITVIGNNTIIDPENYFDDDDDYSACVFVETDLSINGPGSLTITGNYGDAVRCKKDVRLINASVNIPNATKVGVRARNSLCIKDSIVDVTSVDTAIKVTRHDDETKGYIIIDNGNIRISTTKDGIRAQSRVIVNSGTIKIDESLEGIEAQMIDILGGDINIVSINNAINASKISEGDESEESNDEVAFDENFDDGSTYINIDGGKTYITVIGALGDGIDSNGSLIIGDGAEVYVSIEGGEKNDSLSALDVKGTTYIDAGAILVVTSNGNENPEPQEILKDDPESLIDPKKDRRNNVRFKRHFKRLLKRQEGGNNVIINDNGQDDPEDRVDLDDTLIYQPYVSSSIETQKPGTTLTLLGQRNTNVMVSYTPKIRFHNIFITSPRMLETEPYTLLAGTTVETVIAHEANAEEPEIPVTETEIPTTEPETTTVTREVPTSEPGNKDDQSDDDICPCAEEFIQKYIGKLKKKHEENKETSIFDTITQYVKSFFGFGKGDDDKKDNKEVSDDNKDDDKEDNKDDDKNDDKEDDKDDNKDDDKEDDREDGKDDDKQDDKQDDNIVDDDNKEDNREDDKDDDKEDDKIVNDDHKEDDKIVNDDHKEDDKIVNDDHKEDDKIVNDDHKEDDKIVNDDHKEDDKIVDDDHKEDDKVVNDDHKEDDKIVNDDHKEDDKVVDDDHKEDDKVVDDDHKEDDKEDDKKDDDKKDYDIDKILDDDQLIEEILEDIEDEKSGGEDNNDDEKDVKDEKDDKKEDEQSTEIAIENPDEIKDVVKDDKEDDDDVNTEDTKVSSKIQAIFNPLLPIEGEIDDEDEDDENEEVKSAEPDVKPAEPKDKPTESTEGGSEQQYQLPKHFHFDIKRKGDNSGNDAYKWRRE